MTGSPWQADHPPAAPPDPPSGAPLEASEAVYRVLWKTLLTIADVHGDLPVAAATMAAIDLGTDLAIASGLLWQTPDIPAALRALADNLEARRDAEPPQRILTSLSQTLASARPPIAN
jgi:hypothetical protein